MPKTAAQKLARSRRRKAKNMKQQGVQKPKMRANRGPMFKNPQPVNRRKYMPLMGGIASGLVQKKSKGIIGEITHLPYREECIGTFSTAINFTNTTNLILNAANLVTFPWLSGIAAKYEYFKFRRVGIKFVSSSADAVGSTNTALGTVLINTNYDILAPAYASQLEMEGYGGGKLVEEACPDKNQIHWCEPNGVKGGVSGGWRYNLSSSATSSATAPYPASSSAHDYDVGLLQVASAGAQAASVAGRLYMCYEVDLANPLIVPGAPVGGLAHWSMINGTTANNFATSVLQAGNTLLGITLSSNTINFPANQPGNYKIDLTMAGATSATAISGNTVSSGVALLPYYTGGGVRDASSSVASLAATTTAVASFSVIINVNSSANTFVFNPSTIVGAGSGDLFITALPSTILTVDEKEQVEIDELKVRADEQDRKIERLMALLTPTPSSPSLPLDDCKEDDLEQSVHLSRTMASRIGLALGVSMKK